MTEQSDGVTDAKIQAEKVIAEILRGFLREASEGIASKSPDQSEGVLDALGGREIEQGHGPCCYMWGQ